MSNLFEKIKKHSALLFSGLYAVGAGGTVFGSLYFMLPHDPVLMIASIFAGLIVTYVNWHMCKKRVPEAWKTILSKDGLWTYQDKNNQKQSLSGKKKVLLLIFAIFTLAVALLMAALTWQACDYFAPGSTVFAATLGIVVAATMLTEIGLMMHSISDMLKGSGFMIAIKKIQAHFTPADDATKEHKTKLKRAKYATYTIMFLLTILGTAGLFALCFAGKKATHWALNKVPHWFGKAGNLIASWTIGAFSFFGNAPFLLDTLAITGGNVSNLMAIKQYSLGHKIKTACSDFFKHHWKVMIVAVLVATTLMLGLFLGTPEMVGSPTVGMIVGETIGTAALFALFAAFTSKEAQKTKDEPGMAVIGTNGVVNGAISAPATFKDFGIGAGIFFTAANGALSVLSGISGTEEPEVTSESSPTVTSR